VLGADGLVAASEDVSRERLVPVGVLPGVGALGSGSGPASRNIIWRQSTTVEAMLLEASVTTLAMGRR
jgi:hypothetical protein